MKNVFTLKRHKFEYGLKTSSYWSWCLGLIFLLFSGSSYGQVANYAFSQSNGTYTAITGGNLVLVNTDDGSNTQNIGFTFTYC